MGSARCRVIAPGAFRMTLFFRADMTERIALRDQFLYLCKRKGIRGTMKRDGNYWVVRPKCRNITEERKLTAAWSYETCEVEDAPSGGGGRTRPLFGWKKPSRK
jgi:hypothetical protein